MARNRKYASAADRQAAFRARRDNVTPAAADNVTNPSNVTAPAVTIEAQPVTIEQWRLDAQRYMATGVLPKVPAPSPGFVAFKDCPDVPHDPKAPPWLGAGRGVVREHKGKRYVLVARHRGPLDVDALEHGVVTAQDHAARLDQRCEHKRAGWACHAC